jgi:uncharacterized protein (DUF427 family)
VSGKGRVSADPESAVNFSLAAPAARGPFSGGARVPWSRGLKKESREMSDDHPIAIAPAEGRLVVRWRGRKIADTTRALGLKEHVYPTVFYVPRADAEMSFFRRSALETVCPYKGRANYFSLRAGDEVDADAVWTYENPKPGVAAIKDHLAFYPDKVEFTRETI